MLTPTEQKTPMIDHTCFDTTSWRLSSPVVFKLFVCIWSMMFTKAKRRMENKD